MLPLASAAIIRDTKAKSALRQFSLTACVDCADAATLPNAATRTTRIATRRGIRVRISIPISLSNEQKSGLGAENTLDQLRSDVRVYRRVGIAKLDPRQRT